MKIADYASLLPLIQEQPLSPELLAELKEIALRHGPNETITTYRPTPKPDVLTSDTWLMPEPLTDGKYLRAHLLKSRMTGQGEEVMIGSITPSSSVLI